MNGPYLTAAVAPIPFRAKHVPGDFIVEEIPRFLPCGAGDHVYVQIEKTGLTTRHAVRLLAEALRVPAERIGVAGQKDAHAVTRQFISILGVSPTAVERLNVPHIRILGVARHRAKLRLGDLAANRFQLRLRDIPDERLPDLDTALTVLDRRGVPNYFGPQRFGMRGDTWKVGAALLRGNFDEAVALIVGRPLGADPEPVREARALADAGRYGDAARAWPAAYADCRALCRHLAASGGEARRAVLRMDRRLLGFYVSAFQAWIFNQVIAARMPDVDKVLAGDIAVSHATGAMQVIHDPAGFASAAAACSISATGPLVGAGMAFAEGDPGALERKAVASHDVTVTDLPCTGPCKCVGARRAVRFRPDRLEWETGADVHGAYVELRFTLPRGCYATALLREVGKSGLRQDLSNEWTREDRD